MPHALTDRQREYLDFIRNYIKQNESSPRLEEIVEHFGVTPPSAHKMLETLQSKGFLYFGRDSVSGFFIRLIERAGSAETVIEIPIVGKVNQYGEISDFPQEFGHFATLLTGATPGDLVALAALEDIPQASILEQDLIIFDLSKKPQPGDICIGPIGERLFLIQIASRTFDDHTPSLEMAQNYPIPEDLTNPKLGNKYHWYPLAYDDDTHDMFIRIAEEQNWGIAELSGNLILATALRLTRHLAF